MSNLLQAIFKPDAHAAYEHCSVWPHLLSDIFQEQEKLTLESASRGALFPFIVLLLSRDLGLHAVPYPQRSMQHQHGAFLSCHFTPPYIVCCFFLSRRMQGQRAWIKLD